MPELFSAFLIGLVSASHCLGMCGGLMVAAGLNSSRPALAIFYNLGRISTYVVLGAVFGAFADLLPSNTMPYLQVFSGLLLILSALYLIGQTAWLTKIERIGNPLWHYLQPMAKKLLPITSPYTSYGLGIIWGFIPCGLVYTALAFSLSLNGTVNSALAMLFFGLGTFPAMVGSALMAVRIKPLLYHPRIKMLLSLVMLSLACLILYKAVQSFI